MDHVKIKNLYASKNTNKKVKRQPTEWEKIFANRISDKTLILRVKNSYKSTIKIQITQLKHRQRREMIEKMAEE